MGILSIAHRGPRPPIPIKIRPHICTTLAADAADKPRLKVGIDPDPVRALVVGAIDQHPTHANSHISWFVARMTRAT